MGKPKFSRKKYETPSHPWQEDRINAENELIKKYGLKNKKEIWRVQTSLRRYRGQARELLAKIDSDDPQIKKESDQLLSHLTRYNILPLNSTLDDVLALEIESILSRRLQTITYLHGLANTPLQARQLITHGHIEINARKINVPGYMVTKNEENKIGYISGSPLNDNMHPARPSADFKSNLNKTIEEAKIKDKIETEKISEKTDINKEKIKKESIKDKKKEEKIESKSKEKKEGNKKIEKLKEEKNLAKKQKEKKDESKNNKKTGVD
jgi:small subunit ribosomal protein S4